MNIDDLLENPAREPIRGESYQDYLARFDVLGHGFAYSEIVGGWASYRKRKPPERYWHRIVLTLACANELRRRCRDEGAADGMRVNAVYRPIGGASNSQHKRNAALDMDRINGDGELYFRVATRFWCEYAKRTQMGLGLYTWGRTSKGGIRVHIDTGFYARSWHGIRSSFGKPYTIGGKHYGLPVYLAKQMDLDVPTLIDL